MLDMTANIPFIPYLSKIKIHNQPLPLWHAHWRGLVETAFLIRQETATPLERGGLSFLLTQHENTESGIETLRGQVLAKEFLKDKKVGVEAWVNKLCYLINQLIKGYRPIERLKLVMLENGFLAYYGSFYSDQMDIIIYLGSRDDIDGATTIHRKRSEVDIQTRDLNLITEFLPQEIWIK